MESAAAVEVDQSGGGCKQHPFRILPENALDLIGQYDLVLDGSDNFDTRYMINDVLSHEDTVGIALLR